MVVDKLGDKMKEFERMETSKSLMNGLPVLARLDGKSFHTFTKGLERPYDVRLSNAMIETAKFLIEKTQAKIAYTQSDEISLMWEFPSNGDFLFGGKIHKLNSVLASFATAKFNAEIEKNIPEKRGVLAFFDCRVWQVPTLDLAADVFVWREWDATKNSISMAASSYYSAKELHKKNGSEKQEMLFQKGINWNNYPSFFKKGTYLKRVNIEKQLSEEELVNIPEKFRPQGVVIRSEVKELEIPIISKISNKVDVLFFNKEPIIKS